MTYSATCEDIDYSGILEVITDATDKASKAIADLAQAFKAVSSLSRELGLLFFDNIPYGRWQKRPVVPCHKTDWHPAPKLKTIIKQFRSRYHAKSKRRDRILKGGDAGYVLLPHDRIDGY